MYACLCNTHTHTHTDTHTHTHMHACMPQHTHLPSYLTAVHVIIHRQPRRVLYAHYYVVPRVHSPLLRLETGYTIVVLWQKYARYISNTLSTHYQHISNTLATHYQHISNTLATHTWGRRTQGTAGSGDGRGCRQDLQNASSSN